MYDVVKYPYVCYNKCIRLRVPDINMYAFIFLNVRNERF